MDCVVEPEIKQTPTLGFNTVLKFCVQLLGGKLFKRDIKRLKQQNY